MKLKIKKRILLSSLILILFIQLLFKATEDIEINKINIQDKMQEKVFKMCLKISNPFMVYIDGEWEKKDIYEKVWYDLSEQIPLKQYIKKYKNENEYITEYLQSENDNIQQKTEIIIENNEKNVIEISASLQEAVIKENNNISNKKKFIPATKPVAEYSKEQLNEYGFIKETFYTEDPTTQIQEEQADYNTLNSFDATLKQDSSKPQILVYHTHSQETYIDSDSSDTNTTIMGVGEHLCKILREEYGFNVIHHTGEYDVESRDYAYSNAMIGLEKVLEENPSIEVIIDLHRDEVNQDTKLLTAIQDIPMAKFMFFNGLSYTRELGVLESLPNPYVQDNLSFAFQMQMAAEQYYPGLTRRIYLKGYRYNLHYRPKSLLVELGAQTNTVEEAMNSCYPLAHIISMVLNGENKK